MSSRGSSILKFERLREVAEFSEHHGTLVWKVRKSQRVRIGEPMGGFDLDGYRTVGIDGKKYRVCRLVILYFTGKWPEGDVDHKDLNKANDRLDNLRVVSKYENNLNRRSSKMERKHNLPKWVMPHGRKFRAFVRVEGMVHKLGSFDTPEEAHAVAEKFARENHGQFFRR